MLATHHVVQMEDPENGKGRARAVIDRALNKT